MPVQTPDSIDVVVGEATKAPDYNTLRDDVEQALRAMDFGTSAQIAGITPSVGDAAHATDTAVFYVCLAAGIWTPITGGGNTAVGRGYIDGLTMSLGGDTLSISVAAGAARSDDNATSLGLDAAIEKTLYDVFAEGDAAGMRDSAVSWPPSSQWFYLYLIHDEAGAVVNDIFATDDREWEGDTVDMPAAYDRKRYIGAVYYDASANEILDFWQLGDYFRFKTPPAPDIDEEPSAVNEFALRTLTVPGVEDGVIAHVTMYIVPISGGGGMSGIVRPPGAGDNSADHGLVKQSEAAQAAYVLTDGDGQVEFAIVNTSWQFDTPMKVTVLGWEDQRGKNAA